RRLVAHTAGNAFFIEEIVQALVETHALAGERGQYRLGRLVEGLQIPDRVQAVLAARIDRLSGESKAVLQAGAAIGVDVPVALLQAVANASSEEVLHALAELEAADFVRPSALVPDLAYSFKHAITQEVAYATLLKEQRRALHARIVAALEASYPGERRAEHVERLAYHALRAEAWPTAVGYLRDAGERAVARSANREAAASRSPGGVAIPSWRCSPDATSATVTTRRAGTAWPSRSSTTISVRWSRRPRAAWRWPARRPTWRRRPGSRGRWPISASSSGPMRTSTG